LLIKGIINTKAKVNVITRAIVNKLRLLVYTNLYLVLKAVLKDTKVFDKACENVEINIKSIINY